MFDLGLLFVDAGNFDEAKSWFTKAVEAGNSDAKRELAKLISRKSWIFKLFS